MWYCKFCEVEVQEVNFASGTKWMHTPNGDTHEHSTYWFCQKSIAWPKGVAGG